MTNARFDELFGGPAREPESEITQREMDLARSIQEVTEEIVLRMARHAAATTGQRNACLAGGVALNCVANGRLLREGPFERIWVPARGRRRRRRDRRGPATAGTRSPTTRACRRRTPTA